MDINNKYCIKCGLHKNVEYPMLQGKGAEHPDILVIATHPIIYSAKTGIQWNSTAEALIKTEFDKREARVYYTHALKCTPFKVKDAKKTVEKPTVAQVTMCNTFTVKLIQELRPKVVLCVGAVAMKQIMGFHVPIGGALKNVFYHPELDVNVLVTWDTIKILDEDTMYKEQMKKSVELAVQVAQRPKQRRIKTEPKHLGNSFDIQEYLKKLLTVEMFAFDLETTGLSAYKDRITDVSLCCEIGKGVHILWSDIREHFELFQQVMASPVKKMGHNVAFDVLFLMTHDVPVKHVFFDTMIAAHTLSMSAEGSESRTLYGLKAMTWHMTTEGGYEEILDGGIVKAQQKQMEKPKEIEEQGSLFGEEELRPPKEVGQDLIDLELDGYANYVYNKRMERVRSYGLEPIHYYAAMDSDVTLRIYYKLRYEINTNYDWIFNQLIMPLNTVLTKMSYNGCLLDVPYMQTVKDKNIVTMAEMKKNVFASVGYEFNIDSSEQLSDLMYRKLKLVPDVNFMTDGGKKGGKPKPSTDEDALLHYAELQPVLRDVLKYKKCGKQNSTYIDGFMELIDDNNKIHPSFGQSTTATGRLSASSPNLQNIPRDNTIRNMIIASPGHKIVSADLSQAELRILAMLSQDKAMIAAFASGQDFHTLTACNMFGIPFETFDKKIKEHAEARTAAKCVSYSTRVATEFGLLPIRVLIDEVPEVDEFQTLAHPVKVINPDGNYTNATQYYEGGEVLGNIITLANGMLLEGSDDHKIQVWSNDALVAKSLSTIVEGDVAVCQGGLQDTLSPNPFFETIALQFSITLAEAVQLFGFIWLYGSPHKGGLRLDFKDNIAAHAAVTDILHHSAGIYFAMDTQSQAHRTIYLKNTELCESYSMYFVLPDILPEMIWQTNKYVAAEFLSFVVIYLGTESNHVIRINGTDNFVLGIQQMLFMWFGILSDVIDDNVVCIHYQRKYRLVKDLHALVDNRIPLHEIKGNSSYTLHKVNDFMSYALIPVVHKIKRNMSVADLFVPEGNKFNAAGFINNNCINFGVVYQQGAKALAFGLKNDYGIDISEEQAQNFINKFYRAYPGVAAWMEDIKQFVSTNGYIETLWGRRRYLPLVKSSLRWVKESAYRRAINSPVQSLASDIACLGLIRVDKHIEENNIPAKVFSIVHDDILIDVEDAYVEQVSKKLVECMTTDLPKITIPIIADPANFTRWEK